MLYMHESIAKAQVKGSLRSSIVKNELLKKQWLDVTEGPRSKGIVGKKKIISFFNDWASSYSPFSLSETVKNSRSSWHKKMILIGTSHNSFSLDSIGDLYPIHIYHLSTRSFASKKELKRGMDIYFNNVTLHSHFLQRLLQRLPVEQQRFCKNVICEAIFGLKYFEAIEGNYLKKGRLTYHIITPNFVIIATYHSNQRVFVLNTVLIKSMFTAKQKQFYAKAEADRTSINSCALIFQKLLRKH